MKQIKDSEGFVISWNKNREHQDLIRLFVKYKGKVVLPGVKLHDLPTFLWRVIRQVEKQEKLIK